MGLDEVGHQSQRGRADGGGCDNALRVCAPLFQCRGLPSPSLSLSFSLTRSLFPLCSPPSSLVRAFRFLSFVQRSMPACFRTHPLRRISLAQPLVVFRPLPVLSPLLSALSDLSAHAIWHLAFPHQFAQIWPQHRFVKSLLVRPSPLFSLSPLLTHRRCAWQHGILRQSTIIHSSTGL